MKNEHYKFNRLDRTREKLRMLYHGRNIVAIRFQLAVILIDLAIIAFFIATPVLREWPAFLWIDFSVAAILGLDIIARMLASSHIGRWLRQPFVWVDAFILVILLLPSSFSNLGFSSHTSTLVPLSKWPFVAATRAAGLRELART